MSDDMSGLIAADNVSRNDKTRIGVENWLTWWYTSVGRQCDINSNVRTTYTSNSVSGIINYLEILQTHAQCICWGIYRVYRPIRSKRRSFMMHIIMIIEAQTHTYHTHTHIMIIEAQTHTYHTHTHTRMRYSPWITQTQDIFSQHEDIPNTHVSAYCR